VILAAIDDWQQAAAGCALVLDAAVVAAVRDERLAVDSGRFGHRSGAITISALEPMRAIPHRVIVLMGLDAGQFPRQRQRSGFHLMEHWRCLGDPQPADQDRYVLMEALLSARDHLMVSWSSRDGRKGEAMPPATPVRQWLEWLQGALPCGGAALVVEHPANPLDRANFEPIGERPPGSCDRRLLEARQWIETAQLRKPLPLASRGQATQTEASSPAPEDAYTDLRDWLSNPQSQWLAQLGLKPQEWAELLHDLDSLSLDERQRSQLLRQALDGASGKDDSTFQGDPASWLEVHRGQGLLPPLAAGNLEAVTLAQRWQSLHASLAALGEPKHLVVRWGPWHCELEQRGSSVVLLHTAQARSRHGLLHSVCQAHHRTAAAPARPLQRMAPGARQVGQRRPAAALNLALPAGSTPSRQQRTHSTSLAWSASSQVHPLPFLARGAQAPGLRASSASTLESAQKASGTACTPARLGTLGLGNLRFAAAVCQMSQALLCPPTR
jgi:exodeoxyribonuclease V gamma subunit